MSPVDGAAVPDHPLPRLVDPATVVARDPADTTPQGWRPVVIPGATIEAEITRLADPSSSRRETWFVHPDAPDHAPGLAPGIGVGLVVVPAGATLPLPRSNATEVHFVIAGSGSVTIGDGPDAPTHTAARYDAWNVPGYRRVLLRNPGTEPLALLRYTNRPLLQLLGVHLVDPAHGEGAAQSVPLAPNEPTAVVPADPGTTTAIEPTTPTEDDPRRSSPFGTFPLDSDRPDGAWLMPYERLIHPPPTVSPSLHWPWADVRTQLDRLVALGPDYVGRRLYLLYNPRTGPTNGTTPSFFATLTVRPPGIVDRPHRHVSAAINYFFSGSGRSVVGGRTYTWGAGDLMLTAPGWMIHHHASDPDSGPVYELTVQDQPFHIGGESLLWQEDLRHPPILLGTEAGFATNRHDVGAEAATPEEATP